MDCITINNDPVLDVHQKSSFFSSSLFSKPTRCGKINKVLFYCFAWNRPGTEKTQSFVIHAFFDQINKDLSASHAASVRWLFEK